jgi:hypothetical protein
VSRSPYLHALELLAQRGRSISAEDYELGESAQGRAYVKSLHVYRAEGEPDSEFAARGLRLFAGLRAGLLLEASVSPQDAPGVPDILQHPPKPARRSRAQVAS